MGSLEEERLVQMVRDFMESEAPNPCFSASSNCLPLRTGTHLLNLKNMLGNGSKAEAEVLETVLKHMSDKGDAEKTPSLKKWLVMRLKMDGYIASLCQTSWVTSMGCPAGDYEYIDIKMQDDELGHPTRLIVDIDFKAQFELARPSPAYRQLIETLPSIFVGTEKKLLRIISILCSAAKESLRENGLHLPPWRTTSYMQCKWLSGRHKHPEETNSGTGFDSEKREEKDGGHGFNKWMPPLVKHKKRVLGGGSGLSSQFSNMSTINCC